MKKTISRKIILLYILVFLVMLVFNFLTPMISDDYAFAFTPLGDRLTSFKQIIPSLIYHRENTNGRVVSHFLVYVFSLLPTIIFKFINAANTCLIIYYMTKFVADDNENKKILLTIAAIVLLWIFMPEYGSVFLGKTGSINYSWGLVPYLYLVLIFAKEYISKEQIGNNIFNCIAALFVGAYSENGTTGTLTILAILTLLIWIRDKKMPKRYLLLLLMTLVGFASMMLAPSELNGRAGEFSVSAIINSVQAIVLAMKEKELWLLAIFAIVIVLSVLSKVSKEKIILAIVLLAGALTSVFIFAFAAYMPDRSYHIFVTFISVAIIMLSSELLATNAKNIIVSLLAVGVVAFAFEFFLGSGDILSVYLQQRERDNIMQSAKDARIEDVVIDPLISATKYPAVIHEMLFEKDWWYNDCIAAYYGIGTVTSSEYVQ